MISGPDYVISIGSDILGIAGYYTDNDSTQHVIIAAKDGNVYELHWNRYVPPTIVGSIAYFGNNLVDIAGFYTPDDDFQHAVAVTRDGSLHEIYFRLPQSFFQRDPLYHVNNFDAKKGAASFYSPGDDLRHVVIVDSNGNPLDITWNAQQQPGDIAIAIQPTDSQIASISGFLSTNDSLRHIIVAQKDSGEVYDITYPDEQHVPGTIDHDYLATSFNEPLKNVTAFFSPDTGYRHIVVLTQDNLLKDHAYDTQGNSSNTQLTPSAQSKVADITSYYNAYDGLRHVIVAHHDGSLYEITYTSQG